MTPNPAYHAEHTILIVTYGIIWDIGVGSHSSKQHQNTQRYNGMVACIWVAWSKSRQKSKWGFVARFKSSPSVLWAWVILKNWNLRKKVSKCVYLTTDVIAVWTGPTKYLIEDAENQCAPQISDFTLHKLKTGLLKQCAIFFSPLYVHYFVLIHHIKSQQNTLKFEDVMSQNVKKFLPGTAGPVQLTSDDHMNYVYMHGNWRIKCSLPSPYCQSAGLDKCNFTPASYDLKGKSRTWFLL